MISKSTKNTTLANPLDKFSTYSIHHILLACRTTEAAKDFMNAPQNAPTLMAIDQVEKLGNAVPYGNGNTAFLVIDTRRFAQFSVEKLQYEVLINGLEKRGSHGNLATKVDMIIMDAVGISFINFIQWLMNEKMETNFDGMIFMHRVVFVGHTDGGKTETVQSITIPMHLTKLELNLDAQKGTYTAEFMPNMNFDVTANHRWLNIHNAHNYFKKGVNTLGAVVESFEDQLNLVSQTYFNEVQKAFKESGRTTTGDKKYGRLVRYQITLPEEWKTMQLVGAGTADASEIVHKKLDEQDAAKRAAAQKIQDDAKKAEANAAKNAEEQRQKAGQPPQKLEVAKPATIKDTHVSVETDRQITEVLDLIFKQVPGIAELGAGKKNAGKTPSVTFYKHFVGLTSDDDSIMVHIDVVPFEVPNIVIEGDTQTVSEGDNRFYQPIENGRRVPKNFMEFDYIFTGNNKDVLNFDLKLQDLQFMLASQLNLGPGIGGVIANVQPNSKLKNVKDERSGLITARAYDAILMPKKSKEELENYRQYSAILATDATLAAVKASNDYMRNLSMYYAMAPITAILTIRGNPDIMLKFNQNSFLEHPPVGDAPAAQAPTTTGVVVNKNTGKHGAYRNSFEQKILAGNVHTDIAGGKVEEFEQRGSTFRVAKTLGPANYAVSPVFARVNVMGPNVDDRTGLPKPGEDFAHKLLIDNFYVVFKVTNIIERNSFTQQLELYSHNIFGMNKLQLPGGN